MMYLYISRMMRRKIFLVKFTTINKYNYEMALKLSFSQIEH